MIILSNDNKGNIPGDTAVITGGTARFARDFSERVIASGHGWVGVFQDTEDCAYNSTLNNLGYFGIGTRRGITTDFLTLNVEIDPYIYFKPEIDAVIARIEENNVDVIFINGAWVFTWILYAAAKIKNIPYVVQHAGIFVVEMQYFTFETSEIGRQMCKKMISGIAKDAKANIFLNAFDQEQFTKTTTSDIANPVIIPLPYGDGLFPQEIVAKQSTPIQIGCVARWDPIKNHVGLLEFAREVNTQKLPWVISCVTTIPDTQMKIDFKNAYRENIRVVPPMNRVELLDFYRSMNLMILPSHFDISPTVVLEALSVGVPTVISPNVGWVSEYIEAGMSEWIIDFGNPKESIEKIELLLEGKDWSEVSVLSQKVTVSHESSHIFTRYLELFTQ